MALCPLVFRSIALCRHRWLFILQLRVHHGSGRARAEAITPLYCNMHVNDSRPEDTLERSCVPQEGGGGVLICFNRFHKRQMRGEPAEADVSNHSHPAYVLLTTRGFKSRMTWANSLYALTPLLQEEMVSSSDVYGTRRFSFIMTRALIFR